MAQKNKLEQNNSSEMFSEPAACPRHSNNLETKIGEISNFKHLLGLENNIHAQNKPRNPKDSKEIMKKRRERAICIVSSLFLVYSIMSWLLQRKKFTPGMKIGKNSPFQILELIFISLLPYLNKTK